MLVTASDKPLLVDAAFSLRVPFCSGSDLAIRVYTWICDPQS